MGAWSISGGGGGGDLKYIGVHMCEQKKKHLKRGLFCSRMCKAKKKNSFVKIYSNSLDSNLFRGSNLRQSPCLGGDFCILTYMCLGGYFKTYVHSCVHLHIWVPPWEYVTIYWWWCHDWRWDCHYLQFNSVLSILCTLTTISHLHLWRGRPNVTKVPQLIPFHDPTIYWWCFHDW